MWKRRANAWKPKARLHVRDEALRNCVIHPVQWSRFLLLPYAASLTRSAVSSFPVACLQQRLVNIQACYDMTPCRLANTFRRFERYSVLIFRSEQFWIKSTAWFWKWSRHGASKRRGVRANVTKTHYSSAAPLTEPQISRTGGTVWRCYPSEHQPTNHILVFFRFMVPCISDNNNE
jgi:hypothetical protein